MQFDDLDILKEIYLKLRALVSKGYKAQFNLMDIEKNFFLNQRWIQFIILLKTYTLILTGNFQEFFSLEPNILKDY